MKTINFVFFLGFCLFTGSVGFVCGGEPSPSIIRPVGEQVGGDVVGAGIVKLAENAGRQVGPAGRAAAGNVGNLVSTASSMAGAAAGGDMTGIKQEAANGAGSLLTTTTYAVYGTAIGGPVGGVVGGIGGAIVWTLSGKPRVDKYFDEQAAQAGGYADAGGRKNQEVKPAAPEPAEGTPQAIKNNAIADYNRYERERQGLAEGDPRAGEIDNIEQSLRERIRNLNEQIGGFGPKDTFPDAGIPSDWKEKFERREREKREREQREQREREMFLRDHPDLALPAEVPGSVGFTFLINYPFKPKPQDDDNPPPKDTAGGHEGGGSDEQSDNSSGLSDEEMSLLLAILLINQFLGDVFDFNNIGTGTADNQGEHGDAKGVDRANLRPPTEAMRPPTITSRPPTSRPPDAGSRPPTGGGGGGGGHGCR